jgi:hypothetical protein
MSSLIVPGFALETVRNTEEWLQLWERKGNPRAMCFRISHARSHDLNRLPLCHRHQVPECTQLYTTMRISP